MAMHGRRLDAPDMKKKSGVAVFDPASRASSHHHAFDARESQHLSSPLLCNTCVLPGLIPTLVRGRQELSSAATTGPQ